MDTSQFKKLHGFLQNDLWDIDETVSRPFFFVLIRVTKIFYITFKELKQLEFMTHAASLTFTSVLSLVPMLALTFALAKGFGVQDILQPLLLEQTVGKISDDIIPELIAYVNNTDVKALGSIGLLFIIITSISVLGTVENSFNKIWQVDVARTLFRKFSDYLSVLTVGPVLLVATIGLTTSLASNTVTQKLLEIGLFAGFMKLFLLSLPWFFCIGALTFLYLFLPNTKVNFFPALFAGCIAGVSWQFSQFAYIHFQIGIARFNAIYGTFATVPIFLLWIYISWIIVLIGAKICFASQRIQQIHPLSDYRKINFAFKEKISILVLLEICQTYEQQENRSTVEEIAAKFRIPVAMVQDTMKRLHRFNYILPIATSRQVTYVPAKPIEQIQLITLLEDLRLIGGADVQSRDKEFLQTIQSINSRYLSILEKEFGQETMATLLIDK
jgi:membrane protein